MGTTATTDNSTDDWAYAEGDVLDDRYEIFEHIARGAFGEVHAARDRTADRRVALKVLRTGSEKRDPKAVARMRQEAEILRALDHPNLVQVHDIAEVDGRECLVMELLEGRSIRELIDDGDLATPDRARPVVRQILSALMAMHERGVQHRDLKPDNIILLDAPAESGEKTAKLVDFGIAKARDFLDKDHQQTLVQTQDDNFVGTPKYSAPEQAVGDPIDDSSDLFSVGLVVAEWFTGEPRIDESAQRGVVSILIQPEPLDISDCPESWQPWLREMVAKTPEKRFQSAREALEKLPGFDSAEMPHGQTAPVPTQRSEWGEADAPETVDLSVSDTDRQPTVGSPGDPEEPTVVQDDSESSPDGGDGADTSPPNADAPRRPDSDQIAPSASDTDHAQLSRSWEGREDVSFDDETEHAAGPGEEASVTSTFWFTAASVLLFLLSFAIFIYTLLQVLT